MEGFDLPMSFGKKTKKAPNNLGAKLAQTQRDERKPLPAPRQVPKTATAPEQPDAGPSKPQPAAAAAAAAADDSDSEVGPAPPKRKAEADPAASDDDFSDFEDAEEEDRTPVTHEIVLKDHTKPVSAIAVEPSGARVATGSHDYDCKLWDFGGMDSRLRPFKSFEPNGTYFIHDLSYSPDGKHLLAISGTFYPKVFSRAGDDEIEFMKGDVYLRDMKNTKGHTAEINSGAWHPTDNKLFLTAANDSTLRIWDVTNRSKQKSVIIVRSKEKGNRTHVNACAWSPDGKLIAGACLDGALHIWRSSSNLARPDKSNESAHAKGTETTGVAFSPDGTRLVSRGQDETVKLWDVKNLRQPLAEAKGIANRYSETGITFSPDGKWVLVGTAVDPRDPEAVGEILFLSAEDLSVQRRVPIAKGASVVRVLWHSRINQIFASLSNGAVYVLYSPHSSIHGALLPLAKMPRTTPRDVSYTTADLKTVVYTPDALPMFADVKYGQSLHQQEKRAKKFKPTAPLAGAGKGGRIGASATASLVQEIFASGNRIGLEDPREALLKYATEEEQKERIKYMSKED